MAISSSASDPMLNPVSVETGLITSAFDDSTGFLSGEGSVLSSLLKPLYAPLNIDYGELNQPYNSLPTELPNLQNILDLDLGSNTESSFDSLRLGFDNLTGYTLNAPLIDIGTSEAIVSSNTGFTSLLSSSQLDDIHNCGLPFGVVAEGSITINGTSDFDGNPLDATDDVLLYGGQGMTINGSPILPVQRNIDGTVITDEQGRPILVENAVAVSANYTTFNAPQNAYAGLIPPQIVDEQVVEIPTHSDLVAQTLANHIADPAQIIDFNPNNPPINNRDDWNQYFPANGTAETPAVIRVTGWGLNVPDQVSIENVILIVDNGFVNFNGSGHQLNNVTIVAQAGGVNLSNVKGTNLRVLASQQINMNSAAEFAGRSLLASEQSITFNGATTSGDDRLNVISQQDITFNARSQTRAQFLAGGNFTFNSQATLYGRIGAQGNVIFNDQATVIAANDAPIVGADRLLTVDEDSSPTPLNIELPTDPDGDILSLQVTEVPDTSKGTIKLANGTTVVAGQQLTLSELQGLVFVPTENATGVAGRFSYEADDGWCSHSLQVINLYINPVNDEPPTATIDDVQVVEGDSGQANAIFTVSLTTTSQLPITIDFMTVDGTAIAGLDYEATSGTITFNPGETTQIIAVPIFNDTLDEPIESFTVDLLNPVNATLTDEEGLATITDNDEPPQAIINDVQIVEGDSNQVNAVFTISLSSASDYPITIDYATANGTALAGIDYAAVTGTLAFEPGDTVQTITVPVFGDELDEWDAETFTINLSNPVNVTLATIQGTGTISDNDPFPEITVEAVIVSEDGSGTLQFVVTLSDPSGRPITVDYATADGTATAGQDYEAVSGTLTFAVGETVQTVSVPVIDDAVDEPDEETLFLNLSNADYATIPDGNGIGTILDDNAPPQVSIDDIQLIEDGSGQVSAVFTVSLTTASQLPITIDFSTVDGTATASLDYEATSGTLTFDPGEITQLIYVPILDDSLDEPTETFTVVLSNPVDVTIADGQGLGTIVDTDEPPTVEINDVQIVEGDSGQVNAIFTVSLSAASSYPITLDYATTDGTAIAGYDYLATNGTLIFEPGEVAQTISVSVLGDALDEWDEEFFIVNLSNLVNATLTNSQGIGTISDNDPLPSITVGDALVSEDGFGNLQFTVSLSAPSGRSITVDYATADGTAIAGEDYQSVAGTLTFNPGETIQTVTVPVLNDALDESDQETLVLNLSNPSYATFTDAQGQGTILDSNAPPQAIIDDVQIVEGDSGQTTAVFTVSLTTESQLPITIDFVTADGTAIAGSDYIQTSGTLTFNPGETTQTISVPILGDALDEWDEETFVVDLSNPINVTLADTQGTGTISDNDPFPDVTVGDVTVSEDGSGNLQFTVTLSAPSARPITLDYATADGTAIADQDYQSVAGTLTFNPGETIQTVIVPVLNDALDEPDQETLVLNLTNPSYVTLVDEQAVGTITDDDAPPEAVIDDVQLIEGNNGETIARFTVSLSTESRRTITIEYETADASQNAAFGTVDYQPAAGTLAFNPGELSQTIDVLIIGDTLDEVDEAFLVNLMNPINVSLTDAQGTGTILDDDLPPTLSVDDITVLESDEGQSQATFTVSLSGPSSFPVTVAYTTVNGTAIAGDDYLATNGTLTFNPGETTQTVQVTILGDTIGELNEAFELQLSQPVNATLEDAVGQAIITDSDVVLQEGTDFRVGYIYDFAIPSAPSILRFTYSPAFDTSDPDAINDAFEVALVDSNGNPLTHVIAPGRDAFFNWTEEEDVALAAGVTHDAANRTVSLNLTGLPVGMDATVLFRLVNNDSDTTTQVQLANFVIEAAPAGTQPATDASPADLPAPTPGNPDTTALSDVSSSVQANYHQSSFNPDTGRLYTHVSLENIGTYGLNGPLWVAISNISDPSIGVDGADGITADGLPYYDFSHLITNGTFDPTAVTGERSLVFTNPDQIQFTYDLIILSTLNQGPMIESNPDSEGIVGQAYIYDVNATDPDGDALTYDLLVAPDGMTIDAETGLIQWTPTNAALGNHSVWVQVSDGRGGTAQQQFTLAVVTEPTNRPPLFTSDPVIDAFINQLYEYDADAVDPDGDLLDYQIILGPDGMTINSETGAVEWTPPSALVLGDTVLGQIGTPGENDEFTFSGVRGQRIYFDPLRYSGNSSAWDIDIYSPSGELIVNGGELGVNDNRLLVLGETGNYRIVVDAQDDHVGSYGFSLIDLALVPVAPFDQRIEGTLTPGTEDDVYRFSGVKGQKLFIDQISKTGSLDWVLYDASGQQVAFGNSMSDMEIDALPEDGEYYLALRGESGFTSTVSYAFEIITPDELSAPMLLGDNAVSNTVTGEITEKGEEDIYTFEGVAGQRLLLDRSVAFSTHTVSIVDPVGNVILSHNLNTSDPSPLTLDRDGLYQVRVDASGENTGSYGFNLLDLGLATSINLDETRTGTLDPGQESHLYRFSGTSGQRLYFDTQGAAGGSWTLYDSGNQRITSSSLSSDLEVVLDDTDTYTLLIEGNRTSPTSYNFTVITPGLDIEPNPISYDTTVSGEITEKGERDVYTFTGLQGQRLFLDTLDNRPDLRVTLVNPSGSQTGLSDAQFAADWTRNPFVLPEDGQYELIIDGVGEATGSYRFRMADVGGADVLPMDVPTSGTLAPDHSVKFYQFSGTAGDRLYFDSQTTTSSVNWHLYSSSNNEISEVSLNSDFEQVLQADGTYYLMLRSENSQPVSYTIQVIPTNAEPTPIAYTLGTTASGSILKFGEQDVYSVDLTAGQRLYWDAQAGDSAVTVMLVSANGTIFEGDTGQDGAGIFVRESGTYQLIIDGQADATDAYQFQLLNIADQPNLTFGTSFSGTLAAQKTKLYQFTGTKGQQLVFDRLTGGSGAEWILYGPGTQPESSNWTVDSASLSDDFSSTLAADGVYTLAFRNTSDSSVSYNVQVNDVSVTPTTETGLNTVFSGSIAAGETSSSPDQFTFTANAGTLVLLDSLLTTNGSVRGRLKAPDGTLVFDNHYLGSDRDPFVLPQTGTYTFEAYSSYNNTINLGNYQVQFLSLNAASALSLNTTTAVSVAPQSTQILKFSGTEGQKVWFDGLDTSNSDIIARLYNPNGYELWEQGDLRNDIGLQTLTQNGDYYLVLSSANSSTAIANFRLLDNTGATPLTLDQDVSGSFGATKREAHLYTFTGTAGQQLYFDRTSGDFDNYWQLYNPAGQSISGSTRLDRDFEVILPSDGDYVLSVYSYGDSNSSYAFRVVTPDDQSTPISLDQVVVGEIVEPGQQNRYTFNVTAGQKLFFDSLEGAPSTINWRLIAPSGYTVFGLDDARSDQLRTLQETGTYTLEIDADTEAVGSYSFRIFDWAARLAEPTATISLDTPVSGDFGSSRQETHLYQFAGTAGQTIYFNRSVGDFDNRWGVYDQSGNLISNWTPLSSDFQLTLPYTGSYTLRLSGDGDINSAYTFELVTPEFTSVPYTLEDVIATDISEAGEVDRYTFEGTAGQSIFFDSLYQSDSRLNLSILAPSGRNILSNGSQVRTDYWPTLDETGTYTIQIDGSGDYTDNYSFRLFDWDAVKANSENSINLDQVINGEFGASKEETRLYTFSGTEGQFLFFDRTIGDLNNRWGLYSNQNQLIGSWNQLTSDFDLTLPYTGDYTLRLSSYGDNDSSYSFQIVTPDFTADPDDVLGRTITSAISEAGEKDIYTFEGSLGQRLYFDSLEYSSTQINWTLTSPSGETIFSDDIRDNQFRVLPESGTYTLEVDSEGDYTGSYSFNIFDWNETAIDIDLEQTVTGNFNPNGEATHVYRFSGNAGQHLFFDRTAGDSSNYWEVYDTERNLIGQSNQLSSDFELVLPQTGDYILQLRGTGDSNADYSFTIIPSTWTTQSLALGDLIDGNISTAGEQDSYTFEGTVGQQLYFDALSGSSALDARLYSPSGVNVLSLDTNDDWAPFTLTETGTYRLVIDGDNTATGDYRFRLSDRAEATPLAFTSSNDGTLDPGNETHLYQFKGTQGTQLSFDLAAASWPNSFSTNWRLYDPNNNAIATPAWNNPDFKVALPSDGLYTLVIEGDTSSPLNYSFTVADTTVAPIPHTGFNTPVTAAITTAGAVHTYTFDASAGTLLWIDQLSTTTNNIRTRLQNPDGSYIFSNGNSNGDIGVLRLDQTGSYTLETYASPFFPSTTGNWQFQLQELPASTAAASFNPLELNAITQGTLNPGFSTTIYSFQGEVGQSIWFNGIIGNGVDARLYDPNGQSILGLANFNSADSSPITLTQDGIYHLIMDGNGSGTRSYAFQLLDFSSGELLAFNLPYQGSLSSESEIQLYQIEGEAGQQLFFNLDTDGDRLIPFKIYDSDTRKELRSGSVRTTSGFEFTLPEDGSYTIAVGGDFSGGALDYTLQVFSHASTTNNVVVPGTGESTSQDQSYLGLVPVQLLVNDGQNGQATQDFTIRLWPDPSNADPVITSTPVTRYGLNQPFYQYQVEATDPDADTLSYRLVDAPLGALIDQDTGELLWLPESATAGQTYDFTVEILDGRGGTDRQTFTVEAYQSLGTIQGAVWEDLNANGYRDTTLVQGDNPTVVFAIDVSGSTGGNYIDWTTTDVETAVTQRMGILGTEIATAIALGEQLIRQGRGDTLISVVPFNDGAWVLDLDPVTPGVQAFTTPLADLDGNGISDLRQALNTLNAGGGTAFTPPLETIAGVLNEVTDPNLIFLSDGVGSVDPTAVDALETQGVNITAFGIGAGASLVQLEKIDPDAIRVTDPREIIDIFSGWDPRYTTEPLMEHVSVYLDLNNNGQIDPDEPQQITGPRTDAFGETPYQFAFENLLPGTYTVRQIVPNGYEETAPLTSSFIDTVTVEGETFTHLFGNHLISLPPNQDPSFITAAPAEVVELGSVLKYAARATDPDPNPLTYELTLSPKGMVVDAETGVLVWKPTADQLGTHNVMLRVSDGEGGIDLQYFQVTVAAPNTASVFTSTADNLTPQVGKPFQYRAMAQDADGDPLSYRLVNPPTGMAINATTGVLSWTPTATGDYSVTIEADDGRGGVTQLTLDLTVIDAIANTAPTITSMPRLQTPIGNPYVYAVTATDVDGDPLTYQLTTAPSGMTINAQTGLIEWTPTAAQFGEHTVAVSISDGQGGSATQSFTLLASNQASNQAPVITSTPNTVTNLDRLYQYGLTATDADGDALIWRLVDAPDGMVIDAQTGRLSWQPTAQQLGNHEVSIEVFDGSLLTGQSFTLTVNGGNTPPAIVSTPITQAAQDQAYSYQVVATDRENDALTYSLGVHPDGMTIDAQTGRITWTPTADQVGNQTVEVVVQDTQAGMQRQTYTVVVGTEAINHAPSITSTPIFVADVNGTYTYDVDATDPDVGDSLTYELLQSPTGMTIDPLTGVVQWATPVVGNHRVVVGVVDEAGLGAAQGFTLTARANQAPTIRSTPILTAVPGARYAYDVQASDPEGGVLGYALDAASLSKGIQIDAQGRLSWTPTPAQVGTHSITVTVTDNLGATAQQVYDLTVSADTEAPVVRLISTLYPADVGDQVSFQVRATDNRGVTGLQLTLDGTPLTLDRNGIATVTLTQAGTASLVATAYDAAGNQGQATLNLPVIDPTNNNAPIISLDAINGDQLITTFTDIIGSVTDDDLLYYSLAIAPLGSTNFQEFYRATDTVSADTLGTLDPSLLLNDTYTVRLTAEDAGGNLVFVDEQVDITGNLKLGNFTLSFTDLEIPVSGIPISVTRTYDTLTAQTRDDFGFGWRLEFRDTDLRTSLGTDPLYEEYGVRSLAFSEGDRVYLTLPGGQRQGFTFQPRQVTEIDGQPLLYFSKFIYEPVFVTDDGVEVTLSVEQHYLTRGQDGRFYGLQGQEYNPADDLFGGTYTLTTPEGIVYTIEGDSGDLLTAQDTNGNTLTFTEGGITSDTGVAVTFGRDAQGRITTVTDPDGNVIRYGYDALGDLVSVTDQEGYVTQFDYNDERVHYLDEVIDPLGRPAVRSEYDENGRLKRILDVDGDPVEILYDPANSTQTIKDADGNPTFYEYDDRGNVIQQVDPSGAKTFFDYADPNNPTLLTKVTDDNGNVTTYTYDAKGNLASRTETDCGCANASPGTTYYSHNERGQLTSLTLPTGASFFMDYDGRGNLLTMRDGDGTIIQSFTYDAQGRVLTETDPFGTTSYDNPDTAIDFDAFGNPYWMQDAFGEITTMTYDASGRLATMTDDEGTSTFTYDKRGRETRADYGNGIFVEYGYGYEGDWTSLDAPTIGHIERNFTADGKLGGWVTPDGGELTFTYDAAGRLATETTPDGQVTRYEYDVVNRTNRVIDEATGLVAETVYDNVGRVSTRTQIVDEGTLEEVRYTTSYTYYADGRMETMTDARGHVWRYEYTTFTTTVIDPLGRRTTTVQTENYLPDQVQYADGSTASTEYLFDNNLLEGSDYPTRVIDRGGNDRVFTYDAFGRLATATDVGDNVYTYTYGDDGLASVLAPNGEVRQYTYDELDNLASIIYGDSTSRQFDYNAENRLSQVTLESGETITYTYDEVGRIVSEASSTGDTVITTYDTVGRVATVSNSSGTTTYSYDTAGNLSGIQSPNGSSIRYGYDAWGRIIEIGEKATANGAEAITQYGYDAVGNLVSVTDPTGGITTMTYDVVNRLESRTMPNGVTTTYTYDQVDQVTSITHTTSTGTVLASFTYDRDATGQPTKITREDGSYRELSYDASLRLTQEVFYDATGTAQETITYTYDAAGNRIAHSDSEGSHTYSYGEGFQLESVVNGTETDTYSHDVDGRLDAIARDGETLNLDHNAVDQLTLVTNATTGETVTYTYDGDGNRIGETTGTEVRQYLVAPSMGSGLSVQDLVTDGAGNVLANHVYVGANPLMRLDGNGEAVYYLTDAMGSVIGLVDSNGQSVASFDYDGFGNVRGTAGSDAVGEALGGDFRFQGQWLESESGLYYMRARDYDAQTGRFMSRDPVDLIDTEPESMNPYQFAYGNPYVYSDPTGMYTINEQNINRVIQNILDSIRNEIVDNAKQEALDRARGTVGQLLSNFIGQMTPYTPAYGSTIDSLIDIVESTGGTRTEGKASEYLGELVETIILDTGICPILGSYSDYLWREPGINKNSGEAIHSGYQCNQPRDVSRNGSHPDFVISKIPPRQIGTKRFRLGKGWLIGDIKTQTKNIDIGGNQWDAMSEFAKTRQYASVVLYVTFFGDQGREAKVERAGANQGLIMNVLSLVSR